MKRYIDAGSIIIIVITFVLFGMALFTKGFTHDMLLEGGVFLVSVKLIMMAFKNANHSRKIGIELSEIKELLIKQK